MKAKMEIFISNILNYSISKATHHGKKLIINYYYGSSNESVSSNCNSDIVVAFPFVSFLFPKTKIVIAKGMQRNPMR